MFSVEHAFFLHGSSCDGRRTGFLFSIAKQAVEFPQVLAIVYMVAVLVCGFTPWCCMKYQHLN